MKAIKIYNGQIYSQRIAGQEVTSALLRQERFIIISEIELQRGSTALKEFFIKKAAFFWAA
ncbi:hypothetical protein [Brevibacillus sp. SKDU10]|uniref:hypothetical protein n=1 Tax=Brevibacillus sp. SKDU10 TaxID=1247872 RepID=UPI000A677A36|nr:hypothetical protein [Brevibacillus sp. SKDU10]